MTDIELLTAAAKAAGIDVKPHPNRKLSTTLHFVSGGKNWNPLIDDGDALRLAIAIRTHIIIDNSIIYVSADRSKSKNTSRQKVYDDINTATRRAIVRAAAEIGKTITP